MLIRRYVQFVQSLSTSANPVISNLAKLSVNTVRSVTGRKIAKIRDEFHLDPLPVHKKQFHVKKVDIPEGGDENIELLDYLLYLRNNETEEEIVCELNELIANVCSV